MWCEPSPSSAPNISAADIPTADIPTADIPVASIPVASIPTAQVGSLDVGQGGRTFVVIGLRGRFRRLLSDQRGSHQRGSRQPVRRRGPRSIRRVVGEDVAERAAGVLRDKCGSGHRSGFCYQQRAACVTEK